LYASIKAKLETATTEAEVKAAFATSVTQTPIVTQPPDAAAILEMGAMALEAIKNGVEALGK
jgi:hypothetical protein